MAVTALDSGQVTRALDNVSSVWGTVLYRGETKWIALPPGAVGQVLASGGVNANVAWLTLQAGGNVQTAGTPQAAQIALFTGASTIQGVTALPAANFPQLTGDLTNTPGSGGLSIGIALKAVSNDKLADMPANTIKGRTAGTAGAPSDFTISAFLDTISSTRGAIIFRGSGGWTFLNPGTAGQVLQSNGAGADLSFVTPATVPDIDPDFLFCLANRS